MFSVTESSRLQAGLRSMLDEYAGMLSLKEQEHRRRQAEVRALHTCGTCSLVRASTAVLAG